VASDPDLVIALEGPEVLDELRPLWLELHHHHQTVAPELAPFADDATSWIARRESYERSLVLPESFVVVARSDGVPVGYAMVRVEETDNEWFDTWVVGRMLAELETFVLAPQKRGQGVGNAMLDRVESELEARGVSDVVIAHIAGNDAARRLYERRGYRPAMVMMTRFGARTD
jgi:ribosomal protein S18 acetylase RimI-like enzyme